MESAIGASDPQGAWNRKDVYEAVEAAQVLFLRRYARAMSARAENSPARTLAMPPNIAALLPSEFKRSEGSRAPRQYLVVAIEGGS
jgi:hypothetical protein